MVAYQAQSGGTLYALVLLPFLHSVSVSSANTYQMAFGTTNGQFGFGTNPSYEAFFDFSNHYSQTTGLPSPITTATYGGLSAPSLFLLPCSTFTPTVFLNPPAAAGCAASNPGNPNAGSQSPGGTSDPCLVGFWGQQFYVHGQPGHVYSVLSDAQVQLNGRLVYRANVTCPAALPAPTSSASAANTTLDIAPALDLAPCSDHPGTYFAELGLRTAAGDRLLVVGGDVASGFARVEVNGRRLQVGDVYAELDGASPANRLLAAGLSTRSPIAVSALSVRRLSARSLLVQAGVYRLRIDNSDRYVDLAEVTADDWSHVRDSLQPEGLLGVTWSRTAVIPPAEEAHRERDGELFGCNMAAQKHCLTAGPGRR